jgi:lysozyme
MELWRKADIGGERIVVDALVRRRAAEKLLFLTPPDGWEPVPSALLPPKLDLGALESTGLEPGNVAMLEPAEAPVEGTASADGSASERAAAAVGARLQQIFPEPEPMAGPVLRLTPAPEFELTEPEPPVPAEAEAGPEGPTLFDVVSPEPEAPRAQAAVYEAAPARLVLEDVAGSKRSHRGVGKALLPAALALVGLVLFAGSVSWPVYMDGVGGVDPRLVSWAGGLTGVSMIAFAAYLFLLRLGEAQD